MPHSVSPLLGNQRLLVPAYFDPSKRFWYRPDQTWWKAMSSRIYNSLTTAVIVMNPNSGPGAEAATKYRRVIDYCQRRVQDVVGYVDTNYGGDPPAPWKDHIDEYYNFYPNIRGIFLDQMSGSVLQEDYYQAIYHYIKDTKSPSARIIVNPGAAGDDSEWQVTGDIVPNIVVVFEGTSEAYENWFPPAWVTSRPARMFANLIYESPSWDAIGTTCIEAVKKNAGCIYVTQDTLPNPWNAPPSAALIDSPTLYRRTVLAPL